MKSPFVVAALLVLAGCSYEKDYETSEQRLALSEDGCPSGTTVMHEEDADDADLVDERREARGPLCWYRVELDDPSRPPYWCDTERWKVPVPTLDEVRANARTREIPANYLVDPVTSAPRCTDRGPVLLFIGDENGCPALDGWRSDDFGASSPLNSDEGTVRELLARDDRTPLVRCEYEVHAERTHRPFSCGSGNGSVL